MPAAPRYRYGLFLRPPARLARAQWEVHSLLRAQYGLVAAGAFPPHMTVLGHVPVPVQDQDLAIQAGVRVADGLGPVRLYNAGVAPHRGGICHDVGRTRDGSPNSGLLDLFRRAAVEFAPLRGDPGPEHRAGVTSEALFYGHMTLAGHDLADRPWLYDEVLTFINELDVGLVGDYVADRLGLYRFETRSGWDGNWWETMSWTMLASYPLEAQPATEPPGGLRRNGAA
jgi:2'-5' RNA ligase